MFHRNISSFFILDKGEYLYLPLTEFFFDVERSGLFKNFLSGLALCKNYVFYL